MYIINRVISYLGGVCLLLSVNLISFYVAVIKYEGYRHILPKYKKDNDLGEINKNFVELAKIITHTRTYDTFRKFLADIFCVENLDFVTIIAYYRQFAKNGYIPEDGDNDNNDNNDNNNNNNNNIDMTPLSHKSGADSPTFGSLQFNNSPSRDSIKLDKQNSIKQKSINRRRSRKTQDQIIADLVVENNQNGIKTIDITKLELNFVKLPNDLKQLKDIKLWMEWIYSHYITNESDHCLNLPSKMRKKYILEYKRLMEQNEIEEMITFFDKAQYEIWKLMAQDSMTHFRNSEIYSQIMWRKSESVDV